MGNLLQMVKMISSLNYDKSNTTATGLTHRLPSSVEVSGRIVIMKLFQELGITFDIIFWGASVLACLFSQRGKFDLNYSNETSELETK
jgi:hypothetical protein